MNDSHSIDDDEVERLRQQDTKRCPICLQPTDNRREEHRRKQVRWVWTCPNCGHEWKGLWRSPRS
jgi:transposase